MTFRKHMERRTQAFSEIYRSNDFGRFYSSFNSYMSGRMKCEKEEYVRRNPMYERKDGEILK